MLSPREVLCLVWGTRGGTGLGIDVAGTRAETVRDFRSTPRNSSTRVS